MLGRRRAQADAGPSYAVIWANLRKRFPGVRTVLITAASTGDDASVAALGLAEAAVSLDDSSALVLVLHSAMRNGRLPNAPGASVRMIPALSPGQVRTILSQVGEEFPLVIVVAPPPQHDSECIAIGRLADAAILVARAGRTRFAQAQVAAERLRQAGIAIAAAVLLIRRTFRGGKSVDARAFADTGQIAELRPRAHVRERREASAGIDLLT